MFDIGWGELVVIGIVALIAIGPKELPTVLRTLGQWMGKVKRMASEFQGQFQEALREAELHDLKKQAEDLTSSVTDATSFDPLADIGNDVTKSAEPAAPSKTETATATEATIDVPPPELPAPVTNEDFAPAEPPPKQAGGKA
jgi:sec-independent protein translocase protein TatB